MPAEPAQNSKADLPSRDPQGAESVNEPARMPAARRGRLLFGRAIKFVYQTTRPIARHLLPMSLRVRLIKLVPWAEEATAASLEKAFQERRFALASMPPILPPAHFDGPTVLVNNALAWGGVERQIVYTLRGLNARSPETHGLLCLRLGQDANHDFYRSSLVDFKGFVRNVIAMNDAQDILAGRLTSEQRDRIDGCIGWLPPDAQGEVHRFLADFVHLRPAVVHVWQDALSITAGFAARLAGVPRIIVSGRNVAPINFGYHRAHMKNAYIELASCADLTLLNNSEAGRRSYANWLNLPDERFRVLRNGIDTQTILRPSPDEIDTFRTGLGIPEGAPVIGSIFRLYDEKRPMLWMEAAARVAQLRSDAHFAVFGSGPLRSQMLKFAHANGLDDRLHLPGTISNPALAMGLFDVFLLTSEFEGTPNVVLEASLMGIPVVATDAGGTAEAIDEGITGYVVPTSSADLLCERVMTILEDKTFVWKAKHCGPRFVLDRFGMNRMIEETLVLHSHLPKTVDL